MKYAWSHQQEQQDLLYFAAEAVIQHIAPYELILLHEMFPRYVDLLQSGTIPTSKNVSYAFGIGGASDTDTVVILSMLTEVLERLKHAELENAELKQQMNIIARELHIPRRKRNALISPVVDALELENQRRQTPPEAQAFATHLKRLRLRSADPTTGMPLTREMVLSYLADAGHVYGSANTLGYWESTRPISPKQRPTLISLLQIYYRSKGLKSEDEANQLLFAGGHRNLDQTEYQAIFA